jgi:hypothetical protein
LKPIEEVFKGYDDRDIKGGIGLEFLLLLAIMKVYSWLTTTLQRAANL